MQPKARLLLRPRATLVWGCRLAASQMGPEPRHPKELTPGPSQLPLVLQALRRQLLSLLLLLLLCQAQLRILPGKLERALLPSETAMPSVRKALLPTVRGLKLAAVAPAKGQAQQACQAGCSLAAAQ